MLDEPRMRMFKPRNPELGEWKVNRQSEPHAWVKPRYALREVHKAVSSVGVPEARGHGAATLTEPWCGPQSEALCR
jgi:hypothetical protein